MMPSRKSTPAFGMVMTLLAGLLMFAGWMAWRRTVVIDRVDAPNPSGAAITWPDMRLDLNTASAVELSLLPGIGPQRADSIVNDREANGPFLSVSDLTRVKGIGKVTLGQMAPYLVVEPTMSAPVARPDQDE